MEIVYFSFIVFLFMLAVFDLVVGVSNDAVNFRMGRGIQQGCQRQENHRRP